MQNVDIRKLAKGMKSGRDKGISIISAPLAQATESAQPIVLQDTIKSAKAIATIKHTKEELPKERKGPSHYKQQEYQQRRTPDVQPTAGDFPNQYQGQQSLYPPVYQTPSAPAGFLQNITQPQQITARIEVKEQTPASLRGAIASCIERLVDNRGLIWAATVSQAFGQIVVRFVLSPDNTLIRLNWGVETDSQAAAHSSPATYDCEQHIVSLKSRYKSTGTSARGLQFLTCLIFSLTKETGFYGVSVITHIEAGPNF